VIAAAGVTEVDSGVTVTVWAATATGRDRSVAALPSEEHAATRKEDGSNNEAR